MHVISTCHPKGSCGFSTQGCVCCIFVSRSIHFPQSFDATLGFPGEGPPPSQHWSIFSANIGSLKTAVSWKTWDSAITCMQETRIGKNCINSARHTVAQSGKTFFPGALLPGLFASNGVRRTPHGGVGIAAPAELTVPFTHQEDASGKYEALFRSKRVQAVWIQVSTSLKALVFNIYCKTGASQDRDILSDYIMMLFWLMFSSSSVNSGTFLLLLRVTFQTEPMQYPAVANAVNFHQWVDPVDQLSGDNTNRPITFSANGTFLWLRRWLF